MKTIQRSFLVVALAAVVGLGLASLTTSVAAVPCPPADGPVTGIFCGGIGNIPCPGNVVCVDDPSDNCCPEAGGADCGGVCAPRS